MFTARLRALLVLILAAVLGAAAVTVAADASAKPAPVQTVTVTKSRHLVVPLGGKVRIKLATATDGGYSWRVTKKPAHRVATIGKAKVVATGGPGVVGAPSTTYYKISGKRLGRTTIKLVERQPWKGGDIGTRITLTIVVKRR